MQFPVSVLGERESVLLELIPMDWLSTQIEDLVPPASDGLQAREQSDWLQPRENSLTTEDAERLDLEDSRSVQLVTMRASADGRSAYDAGRGLPESIRLYVAGAIEFHAAAAAAEDNGNAASAHRAKALSYFERVLALPEQEQMPRATWASYMAGRTERLQSTAEAQQRAAAHFAHTRDLARSGAPDPLGLAVASLGEEARIALDRKDIPRAIDLYLEQAARGSKSARVSLRVVATRLMADAQLAATHIQDPRVQRLWFAAALAEGRYDYTNTVAPKLWDDPSDAADDDSAEATDPEAEAVGDENLEPADDEVPAIGEPDTYVEPTPRDPAEMFEEDLEMNADEWAAAVEKVTATLDPSKVTQLDQLAALAYATGRFDLAAKLAQGVDSSMASVVRAKLALRAGDRTTAAKEYAIAVRGRDQARTIGDRRISEDAWSRLLAEHSVLQMSSGDYGNALLTMLEAGETYWYDAAYIAERVLSVDELLSIAKDRIPTGTPHVMSPAEMETMDFDYYYEPFDATRNVRLLLARRLMRDGRYDEALLNFRNNDTRVHGNGERVSVLAQAYVDGMRQGTDAWTGVKRAEGLFRAATLAQRYGMELLGYELTPDFTLLNGNFELSDQPPVGPYTTADEQARFSASVPPDERFHYRHVAIQLVDLAADNLPPRSQAFAAVLCNASQWTLRNGDAGGNFRMYERYVFQGAYVGWSKRFGERCEQPDFPRATSLLWKMRIHALRVQLRPFKIPLVAGVATLAAGIVIFVVMRRRSRISAATP